MNTTMFSTYLLQPLIGMALIGVAMLLAKWNKLLANKKLIVYFLLAVVVLAAPAITGWLGYNFMPYGYLALVLLYLILGYSNIYIMQRVLKRENPGFITYLLIEIFLLFAGMMFFAPIFNLVNELQYGSWAATSMILFILPLMLRQACIYFVSIPAEIYKMWHYRSDYNYTAYDQNDATKVAVLDVELFRTEKDLEPLKLKAKASLDAPFGMWFFRLIEDYNRQASSAQIEVSEKEGDGWIFYIKRSAFFPRRYVDYEHTIKANGLSEKHVIIAKRVTQNAEGNNNENR